MRTKSEVQVGSPGRALGPETARPTPEEIEALACALRRARAEFTAPSAMMKGRALSSAVRAADS